MAKMTKTQLLYKQAREESHDQKWKGILRSTVRQVSFEDGYVQGWLMCERHVKRALKRAYWMLNNP